MAPWGKLTSLLRSGLSSALAPAADPRQVYVSAQRKQRDLLAEVAAAMEQVAASKERLAARTESARSRLPELQEQARAELKAGREEMARVLLRRRQLAALELTSLERQVAEVDAEESDLRLIEQRLEAQVEAFAARQEMIYARYSAAEAQVRINEAMTGVSREFADLSQALQRAEEKTETMQARATAIDRLVEAGLLEGPAGLPEPAAEVDGDVEKELAALAAELKS